MSSFENSMFIVTIPLSSLVATRRSPQALSGDFLLHAAAQSEEMYMRRHSLNIFKVPRLKLCIHSKVKKEYMFGMLVLVEDPCVPHRDTDTLWGACSASL